MTTNYENQGYPPSAEALDDRSRLREAVAAGNVLIPYGAPGLRRVQPWSITSHAYDRDGQVLPEPETGLVLATRDIDVAIFGALTGYAGPNLHVPRGTARILFRRNRFHGEPGEPGHITRQFLLSFAGKLALRESEEVYHDEKIVSFADLGSFRPRDGIFEYTADKDVITAGQIIVSTAIMGVSPYELPPIESVDWSFGAVSADVENRMFGQLRTS